MRMLYLAGILALATVFLVPMSAFADAEVISSPEPWDYRNGLLDDRYIIKTLNFYTFNPPHNLSHDNDLSTAGIVALENTRLYVEFTVPVHVKGIFLKGNSIWGGKLKFVFSDHTETHVEIVGNNDGILYVDYNDVVLIEILRQDYNYLIYEIDFFGTYEKEDKTPPGNVTGLTAIEDDKEVTLTYNFPADQDFDHVNIYQDGSLIAENVTDTSYVITGLTNGTTYQFKVTTVDTSGNESDGVTVTATPKAPEPENKEVKNLKAEAKHDRVNLSWQLPDTEAFHHVNIYRKTLENKPFSLFGFMPTAYAAEGYTQLFETNGTYFNDLTVQPETSYEYLLTTEYEDMESPGVTVQVTTLAVPPPNMGGIVPGTNDDGDYTLKWTPQEGEVIIEVDGQEYDRVDAMLGSYTIPAADARDEEGNFRKIRVIPVAPNGTPGKPVVIHPGGYGFVLPFGVRELLDSVMGLLRVLGPFVLLVIVLWYVRPIINLIKRSAAAVREGRYRV